LEKRLSETLSSLQLYQSNNLILNNKIKEHEFSYNELFNKHEQILFKNKEYNIKYEDISDRYISDNLLMKQYITTLDRQVEENKRLKDNIDNYKKQLSDVQKRHCEAMKKEKVSFENINNKLIEEYLTKIENNYNNSELSLAIKTLSFNVQKIYSNLKSNNN